MGTLVNSPYCTGPLRGEGEVTLTKFTSRHVNVVMANYMHVIKTTENILNIHKNIMNGS